MYVHWEHLTLTAACVKWGLKWAGIADVSLLKALGIFFLIVLMSCLPVGITLIAIAVGVIKLMGPVRSWTS